VSWHGWRWLICDFSQGADSQETAALTGQHHESMLRYPSPSCQAIVQWRLPLSEDGFTLEHHETFEIGLPV